MATNYNDYLIEGTKTLQKYLSSSNLNDEEKKSLADAFTAELTSNISDTSRLKDYNYIFSDLYIRFIDEKISHVISDPQATYEDIDKAVALCDEYAELFKVFKVNNWKLPKLKNDKPEKYLESLHNVYDGKRLTEEIIELNTRISNTIKRAQTEFDTDKCNQAISLIKILEEKIKLATIQNVSLPEITYADTQKAIKEVIDFRTKAVQKDTLHLRINETDREISNLLTQKMISKEQWQKIVDLCERQSLQMSECRKNRWPEPSINHSDFSKTGDQYRHYLRMSEVDFALVSDRNNLLNNKAYENYLDLCRRQMANIDTCVKNGWDLPILEKPEPGMLLKEIEKEQKSKNRKRKWKNRGIIAILGISLGIVLFFVGRSLWNKGKVQIPFDSEYANGVELEVIQSELEKAGFTNITTQSDTAGWLESGKVTGVTIDNKASYKKDAYKKPECNIVILVSSDERVFATDMLNTWQNSDYIAFKKELEDNGFTNITVVETVTNDKNKDDKIASLNVNNQSYLNEYCYIPLNAPITINCYSLKLAIGSDSVGFIGQDYNEVVSHLNDLGFTNVKTEKVSSGWAKGNTIIDLTINSNSDYKKDDVFDPEATIIVKYSSDDRLDATDILENWKKDDYQTIENNLKKRGFTNVNTYELETKESSENNKIETIDVGGISYETGDCYIQKAVPISIIYTRYKIEIGRASDDLGKIKYKDFVQELKKKGFTNIKLLRSDDLKIGLFATEETIKSIKIGDKGSFKETATFYPDEPIVIVVYTFKGKGCEDITETAD